jgi:hypothetical protein
VKQEDTKKIYWSCKHCGEQFWKTATDQKNNIHDCPVRGARVIVENPFEKKEAKPDAYMAQDLENRFRSLYFAKGKYKNGAIVIPAIEYVSTVTRFKPDGRECYYEFSIFDNSSEGGWPIRFKDEDCARHEREKLLMQIENFYMRGE